METLGFVAIFFMGIVLGLLGGGGAILTVPILVYVFQINPTLSTTYSLFIVGAASLLGSFVYFYKKEINIKIAAAFSITSTTGVLFSRVIVLPNIPDLVWNQASLYITKDILILTIFSIVMISASYTMISKSLQPKIETDARATNIYFIFLIGITVGVTAGFVGAGGGFLIIPALMTFASLKMRTAIGTSLLIIAIQSLIGFGSDFYQNVVIDWQLLKNLVFTSVLGLFVGLFINKEVQEKKLQLSFGILVLIMGLFILLQQISIKLN
jgi:uncharacterized membrane protein YfcA